MTDCPYPKATHWGVIIGRLGMAGNTWTVPVEAWRDYGVVCPGVLTTNGSPHSLATFLVDRIAHGATWEGMPLSFTSVRTTSAELMAIYKLVTAEPRGAP